jgi:hypothetical protein
MFRAGMDQVTAEPTIASSVLSAQPLSRQLGLYNGCPVYAAGRTWSSTSPRDWQRSSSSAVFTVKVPLVAFL